MTNRRMGKRGRALLTAFLLAMSLAAPHTTMKANAEGVVKEIVVEPTKEDGTAKTEEEIALEFQTIVQGMPIQTNELKGWPEGPVISGEAAIVMDMDTGAILYGKSVDEKHYPASITKVLTALVALENGNPDDMIPFSADSIACQHDGYAHIGMKEGEQISMKDALHAVLLASANEVAYAVGEKVGGTHEHFIEMMNEKARELGCENSNFVNTNGEFEENHYTTPRDMALISKAAYENELFREIIQTKEYRIAPTNLEAEERVFQQKHKMAVPGRYQDERCTGGKTGYTSEAHNTLVTYMEADGKRLVCVDMKSRSNTYEDTLAMLNYGFDNFAKVKVEDQPSSENVEHMSDGYVMLPNTVSLKDLEAKADEKAGMIHYTYEGNPVGSVKAEFKQAAVKEDGKKAEDAKPAKKDQEEPRSLKWWQIALIVIGALVLAFIILLEVALYRRRKRRQERLRRRRQMERRRMRREMQDGSAARRNPSQNRPRRPRR